MGKNVNYFDIGDFHGMGRGSTHARENVRSEPKLGPCVSG
jgi:hypothetical protein